MPGLAFTLSGPFGTTNPTPSTSGELQVSSGVRGRDLEIDPTTGDLKLTEGDLSMVRNLAAIRQEVSIRLQFLLGEWFLDVTQGVPYLQNVLVKAPNLAAIRTVLRDAVLACAGINSITRLDLDYDRGARTLRVTWSATTDLGAVGGSIGV